MNMDLILTLFIGFAALIVAFAVFYIAFELVRDSRSRRSKEQQEQRQQELLIAQLQQKIVAEENVQKQVSEQPQVIVQEVAPVKEEAKEEPIKDDNNVSFNAVQTQTLEEKYALLPTKYKKYYDEICKYAQSIEGNKVIKNSRYEEYKYGSARLVRLVIKRGVVIAEFIFSNSDFKNYASENKISVKQAATSIKIADEESVKVAKDSIDISLKAYLDEREMKKELAKEKRRQAKQQ